MNRVTMSEVAKKAGISQTTVSMVLNNKQITIKDETREKILSIARHLNYRPNHFARSLKAGKTNFIGITTGGGDNSDLANFSVPYSALVYQGITDYFTNKNYKLLFDQFNRIAHPGLELAQTNSVDGLIFLLFSSYLPDFVKNQLPLVKQMNVPYVIIHSVASDFHCPAVGLDCRAGGRLAAGHFIQHGYQTIGCVAQADTHQHSRDLFEGFREGLAQAGRSLPDEFVYTADTLAEDSGFRLAEKMLAGKKPLPRALFVVDDAIAYGLMKKFAQAGVRVPQDLALIGFNDINGPGTFLTDLTSVKQPALEKGLKAAELLHVLMEHPEEIQKPHTIILEPKLTVRKTCGCG